MLLFHDLCDDILHKIGGNIRDIREKKEREFQLTFINDPNYTIFWVDKCSCSHLAQLHYDLLHEIKSYRY